MQLRLMNKEAADFDFMLALKNDPDTRKFAIATHDEIKREDHYEWLREHYYQFYIIERLRGESVGAVRLDQGEISIWVDKAYRGLGIARRILTPDFILDDDFTGNEYSLYARIVDGNVPSMIAFTKAGFVPTEHQDNYYILRK